MVWVTFSMLRYPGPAVVWRGLSMPRIRVARKPQINRTATAAGVVSTTGAAAVAPGHIRSEAQRAPSLSSSSTGRRGQVNDLRTGD